MILFLRVRQCAKPSTYSACGEAGGGAGGPGLGAAGAGEDHHHVLHSGFGGFAQEQTSRRLVAVSLCLALRKSRKNPKSLRRRKEKKTPSM